MVLVSLSISSHIRRQNVKAYIFYMAGTVTDSINVQQYLIRHFQYLDTKIKYWPTTWMVSRLSQMHKQKKNIPLGLKIKLTVFDGRRKMEINYASTDEEWSNLSWWTWKDGLLKTYRVSTWCKMGLGLLEGKMICFVHYIDNRQSKKKQNRKKTTRIESKIVNICFNTPMWNGRVYRC